MSDLTFVAWAQNYVTWAEFSTNHLLSIELKINYKVGKDFV